MGPLPSAAALLGYDQPRLGSGIPYSVPRGTYRARDGGWVAVSTSSEPIARRVMALVGLGGDARFASLDGRTEHRAEVDAAMAAWIGQRDAAEVIDAFHAADAAIAPVLSMTEVVADPHVVARGVLVDVGGVPMQGPIARLSATPGGVRWPARALGADDREVLGS